MTWTAADAWSGVQQTTLQRRVGQRSWRIVKSGASSAQLTLRPGQRTRFRVRASDGLGNDTLSAILPVRLGVRDSSSSSWLLPAGGWTTKPVAAARGGSLLLARGTTDSLVTEFSGSAVGLVAPVGPRRGTLRLRIDDGPWQDIDLSSPTTGQQRVVHAQVLEAGAHRLEIAGSSGQAAVDAIIFLD
jgi:hypothetical protein